MNTTPLARFVLVLGFCIAALNCAAASKSSMLPLGNDTYAITREAKTAFDRDTEHLKNLAKEDAEKFCENQGRKLKVVELTAEKPFFATGYAKAKIVFKALVAGDSEPVAQSNPIEKNTAQDMSTSELYNDLIKLDDLRKKGILTDEEFQREKQKVLNRSK